MKKRLSIDDPSLCVDMPKPYNAENEFHKACRDGSIDEIVKLLKAHPKLINVPDGKLGWTPLYRVTLCGFEDAVRTLLKYEADPNIGNSVRF